MADPALGCRRVRHFAAAAAVQALVFAATTGAADPGSLAPGDANASAKGETVDEIVVVGVRTGTLSENASAFSSTIELDEFEGERRSLSDLLSETVGVQVRRFGGAGERSEVSIRGFSANQVMVTLDGARLNSAVGGGVNLTNIPAELLESIDVQRGGGSVFEGSGAMGGVVSLRTRRPGGERASRATVTGGSFNTWNASLFTGGPSKWADYAFGYDFFHTDGDYDFQRVEGVISDIPIIPDPASATRINNESDQHVGTLSLGRELGTAGHLSFLQNVLYTSRGEPGLDRRISSPIAGQQEFAHSREIGSLSQLRWEEIDLGIPDVVTEASFYYRWKRTNFADDKPAANPDEPIDFRFDDSTGDLRLHSTWEGDALAAAHRVDVELEGRRDAFDSSEQGDRDRWGVAFVAGDELRIADELVLLTPALRVEWNEGFDVEWVPRLGLVISPLDWLRIKSNGNRSYRIPSFEELYLPDQGFIAGNPNLAPEEAWNVDVGVELLFDRIGPLRDIRIEAAYFHNWIDNTIIWIYLSPTRVGPINSDEATTKGVEVMGSVGVGPWLTLSVNHTELDATSDSDGRRLPGRADSETNFRMQLAETGFWKLVGELQRTGPINISLGDTYELSSRKVWNASAGLNVAEFTRRHAGKMPFETLWLSISGHNLGDVAVRDVLSFPQPGRNVSISLEGGW